MTKIKPWVLSAALVCVPAFAETPGAVAGEANPIGVLQSRTHRVEIFTSEREPLYTVYVDGAAVAEKLSLSSLRKQVPEAYELLASGVARDASLSRELVAPERNSRLENTRLLDSDSN